MKKTLITIMLMGPAVLFFAEYFIRQERIVQKKENLAIQKEFVHNFENLKKRVNFEYDQDGNLMEMAIKPIKLNKSSGGYSTEIDHSGKPTYLKLWVDSDHEKIANFNLEGYGYSPFSPNYFLSETFLKDIKNSLFAEDSSAKLIGVDYYKRGLFLENIIYVQKNKKLDTLIINNVYGSEPRDIEKSKIRKWEYQ